MDKKIKDALTLIAIRYPYIYGAIRLLKFKQNNSSIPTMATNGIYIYYNSNFIKDKSLETIIEIIGHELAHVVANHTIKKKYEGLDYQTFIEACEFMANHLVIDVFKMSEDNNYESFIKKTRYYNKKYSTGKWLTIDIYKDLLKKKKEEMKQNNNKGDDNDEKNNEKNNNNQNIGKITKKQLEKLVGDFFEGKNEEEKEEIKANIEEIINSLIESSREMGEGTSGLVEELININKPKINWKEICADWISYINKGGVKFNGWKKRYLPFGVYIPKRASEKVNVAIAVDTSGSMSLDDISYAVGTIIEFLEQFENVYIRLYIADWEIHKKIDITSDDFDLNKIMKNIAIGRGGTSFIPVFEEIEKDKIKSDEDVDGLIYITDMYGDFPENPPDYKVLWISVDGIKEAPFGKVINIKHLK